MTIFDVAVIAIATLTAGWGVIGYVVYRGRRNHGI